MSQLTEYFKEHYLFKDNTLAEALYREHLKEVKAQILEKEYGFIIYHFLGDACIIKDIYTTLDSRKTGKAWDLFREVRNEIHKHPECHVIIGFSERNTRGDKDGRSAMLAAGFIPAYELTEKTVFIRGTN